MASFPQPTSRSRSSAKPPSPLPDPHLLVQLNLRLSHRFARPPLLPSSLFPSPGPSSSFLTTDNIVINIHSIPSHPRSPLRPAHLIRPGRQPCLLRAGHDAVCVRGGEGGWGRGESGEEMFPAWGGAEVGLLLG